MMMMMMMMFVVLGTSCRRSGVWLPRNQVVTFVTMMVMINLSHVSNMEIRCVH